MNHANGSRGVGRVSQRTSPPDSVALSPFGASLAPHGAPARRSGILASVFGMAVTYRLRGGSRRLVRIRPAALSVSEVSR